MKAKSATTIPFFYRLLGAWASTLAIFSTYRKRGNLTYLVQNTSGMDEKMD